MKVINFNGTSDNSCKCGSWLEHRKKFTGRSIPIICPEQTCTDKPEVGAHVLKDSSTDKSWYIVPLCKKHNAQTGQSLNIVDTPLASANVANTCGKK
jgi:hypothetical protein